MKKARDRSRQLREEVTQIRINFVCDEASEFTNLVKMGRDGLVIGCSKEEWKLYLV